MTEPTCKTCRWYTEPDGGVCRLLPPRAGFDVDSPKALPPWTSVEHCNACNGVGKVVPRG